MEYTLDETTVSKFCQFGCNVFGIDKDMEPMAAAKKSIELLADFFFNTLGLKSTFTEIGIDDRNLSIMAKKACGDGVLPGFKALNQQDIENIYKMCL
jgi:alcohol dehydrogenase YqhD (iron-dependent ADH family)